jgi:probable DNA metabolism protein
MVPVVYDGTFEGFLSAVFIVYDRKIVQPNICRQQENNASLFAGDMVAETNEANAKRVWNGLAQKLSVKARQQLYHCFLSELKGFENVLLRYIQYAFSSKGFIETDFSNADVLLVKQTAHKVHREKHRMEAFVRFEKMKDELYFSMVQPDFNVLPLIVKHFRDRYADQRWLIYDARRKYGIYYDLHTVEEVQFSFSEATDNGNNNAAVYDESEAMYQLAWKQYFTSVNIVPRKNLKLHIQHMPKRYWKHLTEKK